jgi:pilus assembly protein TadC
MGLALFLIIIGVCIALLFRFRRSSAVFGLAAASWIGAFVWNAWILSTCPGDCGIRVDLVLIAPVVLIATGFALSEAIRRRRNKR